MKIPDDTVTVTLTVREVREIVDRLIDLDLGTDGSLSDELDRAQGVVFSGERKRVHILLQIELQEK